MHNKCIHTHIYEGFKVWSCIQAYKGDVNVYGPLWTLTCIHAVWTYFFIILYVFPFLFLPKKTLSLPISSTIAWQTFPIITSSCMTLPSYILLFSQHSPVICKDYFSLVYNRWSIRFWLFWYHLTKLSQWALDLNCPYLHRPWLELHNFLMVA